MSGLPKPKSNGRKDTGPYDRGSLTGVPGLLGRRSCWPYNLWKSLKALLLLVDKQGAIILWFWFIIDSQEHKGAEMSVQEELVERLMKENVEFAKAREGHAALARQLEELEKKPFLTPQDETEIKILKKKKLAYKDQMEKILLQYR
jgi:uncharacterized protein